MTTLSPADQLRLAANGLEAAAVLDSNGAHSEAIKTLRSAHEIMQRNTEELGAVLAAERRIGLRDENAPPTKRSISQAPPDAEVEARR
jgi:hypothetical protein